MTNFLYNDYVVTLSNKFARMLDDISADFNFDYGDEFEIAICKILRMFLPNKYGICRGHVVNSAGTKQGDDIIVYDQERFPTLKLNDRDDYSRKENIPIEAVYAYIEAKHKLDSSTFKKAFQQIKAVKGLILERPKVGLYQHDPYIDDTRVVSIESIPTFRNPVFCMIISRFASDQNGEKTDNPQEIQKFLENERISLEKEDYEPELIIAGKSNFLSIGYLSDKGESIPTKFTLNEKST